MDSIQLMAGTVIGRDHRRSGRNNQDAYSVLDGRCKVAVVSDGCGSGEQSEVGAQIGCQLAARAIQRYADRPDGLERARQELLTDIHVLARQLGESLTTTLDRYFFFTLVGAVISPAESCFFSIGDGLLVVNGEEIWLGPFPGNAPPYVAYALTTSESFHFQVHRRLPTEELTSFLIGTDGVQDLVRVAKLTIPGKQNEIIGPLCRLWEDERYSSNPYNLQRRLTLINRDHARVESTGGQLVQEYGRLPDDTTLVVGRRSS